jgi:acetyl esterase/lipase
LADLERRNILCSAAAFAAGLLATSARAGKRGELSSRNGASVMDYALLPFADLPSQGSINDRADAYGQSALGLSRIAAMTTRCELGIPYGPGNAQKLDIYLPSGTPARDLPVMINIHGGAWRWGYKEWMGLNAPPIIATQAIYVSVEYALAPVARYPRQLDDCTAAVAWVHKNISRYGGDPNRICIGGHSAGAHLAALVTLRRDRMDRFKLPQGVIKACLICSGAYDFRDPGIYGLPAKNAFLDDFLSSSADAGDASPITWVKGNTTPFFVTWGENDRDDAKMTAPAFLAALREQPGRAEGHMFPLLDHFWMHLAQQSPDNLWVKAVIAWLHGDARHTPIML